MLPYNSKVDTASLQRFRSAYWDVLHELDTIRLRAWERSRITLPQLRVLFQIRRTPGITVGQLSKLLGVTFSTTSGLVSKLSERGLVARSSVPGDRRQATLELTEAGAAEAAAFSGDALAYLVAVGEALGDRLPGVVDSLEELARVARELREARG